MWMDVDIALAEVPVNIMPLIDDTDFKSIEAAVVFNAAGMALKWHFVTTAGVMTETAVTPTSAGVHDWTDQGTSGLYALEIPASAGTINNDTEGYGWFTGVATGILPWRGPIIGFRAAALNNALIDGGDVLDVSLTEMGGVAQSAADLKDFADDGYNPTTNLITGLSATGLDAIVSTATGMVEIAKAIWDRILTGATHNIVNSGGRRLRQIQEQDGYEGGQIWVDTLGGTAGTTDFENGTVGNPVLTWADALTLNTSLGFNSFRALNGTIILLSADSTGFTITGLNWELQLGNQIITRAVFVGANKISGIGTDGAVPPRFIDCLFENVTLPPFEGIRCCLTGTITASAAGDYLLVRCHSLIAGVTTPIFDFGAAVGNVNLSMPGYARGIEIRNLDATGTDEFSISGQGQIIYAASCSGDVQQSGDWKETNTGGVTINRDLSAQNTVDILLDTGTTIPASIAALPTASEINLEMVDVMEVDTHAELSAVPAATVSYQGVLLWNFALQRNKLTQTATTFTLRNDADSGNIATAAVSDDTTTFTRSEFT